MRGPVFKVCALSLLAILLGGAAYAAVTTDSETISLTQTDWSQVISLEKFHGDIANLDKVVITLVATGQSDIGYENRASKPADIQLTWTATVSMKKGGSTLLSVAPAYSNTVTPAAYDLLWDWSGTSGGNFTTSDTKSDSMTLTSGFSDYVGDGTFDLEIVAAAISQTIGTGNVASYYLTSASATATVEYYTPEPASIASLAAGLLGIVGFGIRRRR
ncbi:choice-of-anchor E domain-containing protein [bacterium]|nr:choice-of-anchor E domain-containing protein [bacterium]